MQVPKRKEISKIAVKNHHIAYKNTFDFLYIVGIQTIRLLNRVRRRLSRFFKPVTNLCKLLYARSFGKQISRLKKEIRSIKEGFLIAGARIAKARKQGFRQGFKEVFRVIGKSFVRHKRFVFSILNVLAPTAMVILLIMTVHFWNGLNYGLVLAYDGHEIATIEDEKVFEQATEMVSQRMVHDTAGSSSKVSFAPSFKLSVVDASSFSVASFVCDQIIQQSNGIIEEASGLYVNGDLLGVVKSSADLRYMLQNLLSKARGSDKAATATFSENVETVNGLFPTTTIMTTDAMNKIISGTSKSAVTYTVTVGDTVTSIAKANNTTIADLNNLNKNQLGDELHPGDLINLNVAAPMLDVEMVKTVTYLVPMSFQTVTEKNNSQYTDYSKLKKEGVNGVQQCVDKVYYVNGVESKRDVISRTVTTPSIDKVVVTGTKKRSQYSDAGVSSGNLIWPVPSLHMITTYFAWRWGSFHTGIDISGSGAYGRTIVAADGGTVVSSGWSNGYGNCVKISHENGIVTLYGHASRLLVTAGQRVSKGQAIALIGSTGNSTGPHCHFEVIKNGTKVNPLTYVN